MKPAQMSRDDGTSSRGTAGFECRLFRTMKNGGDGSRQKLYGDGVVKGKISGSGGIGVERERPEEMGNDVGGWGTGNCINLPQHVMRKFMETIHYVTDCLPVNVEVSDTLSTLDAQSSTASLSKGCTHKRESRQPLRYAKSWCTCNPFYACICPDSFTH